MGDGVQLEGLTLEGEAIGAQRAAGDASQRCAEGIQRQQAAVNHQAQQGGGEQRRCTGHCHQQQADQLFLVGLQGEVLQKTNLIGLSTQADRHRAGEVGAATKAKFPRLPVWRECGISRLHQGLI